MFSEDADCHKKAKMCMAPTKLWREGEKPWNLERAGTIKQSETHGRVSFLTAFTDVLILCPTCRDEYGKRLQNISAIFFKNAFSQASKICNQNHISNTLLH